MDPLESFPPNRAFQPKSPATQMGPAVHCVPPWHGTSDLPSFHLANRCAYNRLDQPSHCTFTAEVTLRSTFQRSRGIIEKGWHLFLWNALRVQLRRPLCLLTQTLPFTHVKSYARSKLHSSLPWGGRSQVVRTTVETD
jgi:hypothetical protein